MPTENESTEKAYVKKHKLNQTLNELFLALTQNKPENPIEFAINHFQSKLPSPPSPPPPPLVDEIKTPNILNISNALSNLNAIARIDKIILKENKKLTEEEILEKEFISVTNDLSNEDSEANQIKISYKSDLKKREMINKHKQDLKVLVEQNLNRNKSEPEIVADKKQSNVEDLSEEEKELIQNEIAFADSSNFINNKKKKKQQQERDKRINFRASIKNNNESMVEQNKFTCSVCGKSKQNGELNKSIKDDINISENKSEAKKTTESIVKSNISTNKNIFDLLIEKSNEQHNKSKQNDTFDDDNIESASQVNGPRPIDSFDPGTSRSINIQESNYKDDNTKSNGVLGWLLTTQQHMNSENLTELKNEMTTKIKSPSIVSKTSTLRSNNDEQHWNKKQSSSGSETSIRIKNKK